MRVLLIADANSLWTRRTVREIYLPLGCRVTLAAIYPPREDSLAAYATLGVPVLAMPPELPLARAVPGLRGWAQRRREARFLLRRGPYDQAHVQQMVPSSAALARRLSKKGLPVVCSYWGSDVFRVGARCLRRQRPLLRRALAVAVQSLGMRDALAAAVGDSLAEKIRVATFGVDMLPHIDRALAMGRAACRRALGLPEEGYLAVLGSNASPSQQHEQALRALSALPEVVKSRLHVAIPLTYNGTPAYIQQVRDWARENGLRHTILTEFLDGPTMALLRAGCDALVQTSTTDALSAAMQETLYAGARVLNPPWLRYPELEALGYAMDAYPGFDALADALARLMDDPQPPHYPDRQVFRDAYAWSATRKLYEQMMLCQTPARKAAVS